MSTHYVPTWHSHARKRGREWAERIMADKPREVNACDTPESLAREMQARLAEIERQLAEQGEYLRLILEQLTK